MDSTSVLIDDRFRISNRGQGKPIENVLYEMGIMDMKKTSAVKRKSDDELKDDGVYRIFVLSVLLLKFNLLRQH